MPRQGGDAQRPPRNGRRPSLSLCRAEGRLGPGGRGGARLGHVPAALATVSSRCRSTLQRWYGLNWGRLRTCAHSGRYRSHTPSWSSVSMAWVLAGPADSSRRKARLTSSVHGLAGSGSPGPGAPSSARDRGKPSSADAVAARRASVGSSPTSGAERDGDLVVPEHQARPQDAGRPSRPFLGGRPTTTRPALRRPRPARTRCGPHEPGHGPGLPGRAGPGRRRPGPGPPAPGVRCDGRSAAGARP